MDIKNIIFIIVGAVIVVLAAGGVGYAIFFDVKSTATQTTVTHESSPEVVETEEDDTSGGGTPATPTAPSTPATPGATTPTKTMRYRDGTFTKEIAYDAPLDLTNAIEVTATLKSNKIISLKTICRFSDDESQKFIDEFNKVVAKDARGKDISTYQPSRLGGASLTTKAFVEALAEIKAAA